MGKFCSNCGSELKENSNFCSNCGTSQENQPTNNNVVQIQQTTSKNNNNQMSGWLVLLIVVFALGLGYYLIAGDFDLFKFDSDEPIEDRSNIEYQKITVEELNDELDKNAALAKEKYNGKYLEITGKLSTIDSDLKYISIESTSSGWNFDSIHCKLKDSETKEKVKTLTTGQTIIVKGKITDVGEVLGYYFDVHEILTTE